MKILKNNVAVISLIIATVIPAIIWLSMLPLSDRFSSTFMIFRSLGQIAGLLGMTLLSINFVLSARAKFLDKWFNGLNKVYTHHHIVGVISFCLIILHPTFLLVQYLSVSLSAAFEFILPGNFFVDLGKVALGIFIILMFITLYLHFKYQNWKNTHKFLGIVLIFSIVHMLYVPSDISNNNLLKFYMMLVSAFGLVAYFYRTIFSVYKKSEYKYKLKEFLKINDSIVELKLSPISRVMRYAPGQFVFVRFDKSAGGVGGDILSESHPFSLASAPDKKDLSFGIKVLGDYTSMMYLLKPGSICNIEGPFGVFSYKKVKSKRQIWIAGGIGITPFLAMAREIDTDDISDYDIDLYYSVKNASENAFAEELQKISERHKNFKFHLHLSEKDGYVLARSIVLEDDAAKAEVFVCGPKVFMKNLRDQFVELGFNNNQIHSEEFNLY